MVFLLGSVVLGTLNEVDVLHLEYLATRTLFLCDPLPILVSNLELTQEANNLVAIVAFLGFDRNLLADHAR